MPIARSGPAFTWNKRRLLPLFRCAASCVRSTSGPQSPKALCWAAWLAKEFQARLTVLHVTHPVPDVDGSSGSRRYPRSGREELRRLQETSNVEADLLVLSGEPAHSICTAARGARGGCPGDRPRLRSRRVRPAAHQRLRHHPPVAVPGRQRVRRRRDKLQEVTSRTLYQVLEESARVLRRRSRAAPAARDGAYLTYSWNQYRDAAKRSPPGCGTLGIGKGDVVALNSETRLEFYLADLGIMTNGSIAAAMYPSYPPKDLVRTIAASGARAVFVEDPKTLGRAARRTRGALDPADRRGGRRHHARRAARARPRGDGRATPGCSTALRTRASSRPITAILYLTSGATGEPKMALVTHQSVGRQYRHGAVRAADRTAGLDRRVSALGAHRAARRDRVAAACAAACRSPSPRAC